MGMWDAEEKSSYSLQYRACYFRNERNKENHHTPFARRETMHRSGCPHIEGVPVSPHFTEPWDKAESTLGCTSRKKTPTSIQILALTKTKCPWGAPKLPKLIEEPLFQMLTMCLSNTSLPWPKVCRSQLALSQLGNEIAMRCAEPHTGKKKCPIKARVCLKSSRPCPELV